MLIMKYVECLFRLSLRYLLPLPGQVVGSECPPRDGAVVLDLLVLGDLVDGVQVVALEVEEGHGGAPVLGVHSGQLGSLSVENDGVELAAIPGDDDFDLRGMGEAEKAYGCEKDVT